MPAPPSPASCNRLRPHAPQGFGVYVFGSGQRYEGCWAKGKKHGWSVYTVETGACALVRGWLAVCRHSLLHAPCAFASTARACKLDT